MQGPFSNGLFTNKYGRFWRAGIISSGIYSSDCHVIGPIRNYIVWDVNLFWKRLVFKDSFSLKRSMEASLAEVGGLQQALSSWRWRDLEIVAEMSSRAFDLSFPRPRRKLWQCNVLLLIFFNFIYLFFYLRALLSVFYV